MRTSGRRVPPSRDHSAVNIFDNATVAELIGLDAPGSYQPGADLCPQHHHSPTRCANRHPTDEDVLAWVRRTFPDADELDHYAFAELVSYLSTGWLGGWGCFGGGERTRDEAAMQLVQHARGDFSTGIVQVITVDEQGRHVPPGGVPLADWTRWMFARLVSHYLEERDAEATA